MTAGPAAADGTQPVTCPRCSLEGRVDPASRAAAGFCPSCDYPLFWARERIIAPPGSSDSDDGLRRLPGTAGRVALVSAPCPACTEPNALSAVHCGRCGAQMRPAPVVVVAEPEPEPEPEVLPPVSFLEEVDEPAPGQVWPWVVLLVLTLLVAGGLLVLLLH